MIFRWREVGQDLGKIRKTLLLCVAVASPFLLVMFSFEALAWRLGETMPMSMVAAWQSKSPDRTWRGGDGKSYLTYKVSRVRLERPDVIMLGASRANSLRQDMFEPYKFYNASLTSWTFDHYAKFLEMVTSSSYHPKVLIFNLDYWMFSKNFDRHWVHRFYTEPAPHVSSLKVILDEMSDRPMTVLNRLSTSDRIKGLFAALSGSGFRYDGSLFGQPQTPDPNRLLNDGVGAGIAPVELGDELDREQMRRFERFARIAREKGITLVGIQLPYYRKVLTGLNSAENNGIWRQFESPEMRQYLESAGVIFFDYAKFEDVNDKPEFFVDSIHPDQRAVGRIMREVLSDPRVREVLPLINVGS
ncbi:MAG: hypothetical protein AB7M05_09310 [Alphaproteobacteria bacterium]